MIRLHRGPPTVAMLRADRYRPRLSTVFALVGLIACSGENPAAPRSLEATSATKQLSPPNVARLATLEEVNAVKAEIESMRVNINAYNAAMGYPMDPIPALPYAYDPPPPPSYPPPKSCPTRVCTIKELASRASSFGTTLGETAKGRTLERRRALPRQPRLLFANCPQLTPCASDQQCDYLRSQMKSYGADYFRAYHEFVTNFIWPPWDVVLNFLVGGPVDRMRDNFRQMVFIKMAYDDGCNRPSGGGGGSGF